MRKTETQLGMQATAQTWVGLVRAVNVGGTGKLSMQDLAAACEACGLTEVKTYLASGNVLFRGPADDVQLTQMLEARLTALLKRPATLLLRSVPSLQAVLARNPFQHCDPARTLVYFLPQQVDGHPAVSGQKHEEIFSAGREIFVHYPDGISDSRLRIPAAQSGTARNLNTVNRLLAMGQALDASRTG